MDVVGETSHTPSQQKSISKDVRPDYVIYTLASRSTGSAKISMIEVKRKSTFINDRSICISFSTHSVFIKTNYYCKEFIHMHTTDNIAPSIFTMEQ